MEKSVAVVGIGAWGKNLARNFNELGALGAVCCLSLEEAGHAQWDSAPLRSFDHLLADASIAGIVIATPTPSHFLLAKQALEAGKHVFVEKPLTETAAQAQKLCTLAAKQDKTLMVGHLLRYHRAFERLCEEVHGGIIGDLRFIESRRCNFGKFRAYETVVRDFAPHDLSMIQTLLPQAPFQWQVEHSGPAVMPLADQATIHFQTSGVTGSLFLSRSWPIKEQRLVVQGTMGVLVFDDTKPWAEKVQLGFYRHCPFDGAQAPSITFQHLPLAPDEPLKQECRHFLHAMDNPKACRTPGTQGLEILQWLEKLEKPPMACVT